MLIYEISGKIVAVPELVLGQERRELSGYWAATSSIRKKLCPTGPCHAYALQTEVSTEANRELRLKTGAALSK